MQGVQALHFAAAAVDELPEAVLLEQRLHVLQEETLAEQGQLGGVVDLWGQWKDLKPTTGTHNSSPSQRNALAKDIKVFGSSTVIS